ncbi:aldo/keto reductase [Tateyamaria omphalii]|uniref:aldo/keto reductase n=1 Tax=Tateyamaria omphalii TaxID=299262 RepID=UPI001C993BC0|nr:aldo/keto reductase [Tateyamaria omphalii]MBY5932696.1 aldo/keto reductase [Tateyamaria omphalii]
MTPDRTDLTEGLNISRILTGLWQVADQERDGRQTDLSAAADALQKYAQAGFDTFDMADHYGSAELIAGKMLRREPQAHAFTKWCPEPGPMTPEIVRAGVQERLDRLGVDTVDLLQFHWWSFEHPAWLDALRELATLKEEGLIRALGVTNFDAAHLELALAEGIPLVSNQVSFSLVDRRAAGHLADLCRERNVRLLAYGTLCGGFLTDKWLDQPKPEDIPDWSRMKYMRFIETAGGWDAFQAVLRAAAQVARKHGVSVSNVASRWVLEQAHVAGVIIGARLGEAEHRTDNLKLFQFSLDAEDHALLDAAFARTQPIPGDCGDEYRQPPFLTASGDLSHHLSQIPSVLEVETDDRGRRRAFSGSKWEPIAGYCRGLRDGARIVVSGTTATHGHDHDIAPGDAGAQTTYILDKIAATLTALGAGLGDVVRTRTYIVHEEDVEAVSRAHGRVFGAHPPTNTTFVVGKLVGDFRVEIEAEALVAETGES